MSVLVQVFKVWWQKHAGHTYMFDIINYKGKGKGEVYGIVSTLQRSHTTSHTLPPGHWVCACKRHLNSMGSIQARVH